MSRIETSGIQRLRSSSPHQRRSAKPGTKVALAMNWMFESRLLRQAGLFAAFVGFSLLLIQPALAHHPFGGTVPTNFLTGFLSGLGHPVIGIDHFVFVIAIGLLTSRIAADKAKTMARASFAIPVTFVVAAMAGTGIHLMALDLPVPEVVISVSVLCFGVALALRESLGMGAIAPLTAIAGIFHGYAYGEAIVGAEMTPLIAYLAGFTTIQLAIALSCYKIGTIALKQLSEQPALKLRFAGFTICGMGLAFLTGAILA